MVGVSCCITEIWT